MQESNNNNNNNGNKPGGGGSRFNYYWVWVVAALVLLGLSFFNSGSGAETINPAKLKDLLREQDVRKIVVVNEESAEIFLKQEALQKEEHKKVSESTFGENTGPHYRLTIPPAEIFAEQVEEAQGDLPEGSDPVEPTYENRVNIIGSILNWVLPIVIIVVIWIIIMRRLGGGGAGPGSQIFNIGRSKATLFEKNTKVKVTFKDVAGLDEAKEEVMEVVDFLKNKEKYTSLGGKIPKGVLLVGPPGTGKTLLAKAVAGEADVPFFSISGSDFVEMFVGVGASRVRDLFKQARSKAPCIIFVDEIDAIGRARGRNSIQGNDERENTLNQLLVEMDGFGTESGVILMAATNRPDVLDKALLRPGRFDRQITIDKPDLVGREQIFKVHLKPLKIGPDVDPKTLAMQTPGFAGADIANVCNESALVAARRGKKAIDMDDFNYALDRVIGGLEKKNKLISPEEKRVIAYHEAGHAICGWYLENASPLVKVTIVPRGMGTLGYAQYLPKEQYIQTEEQLADRMCMTLGGRAAEANTFGRVSTGAQNDLERVTQMAYSMVTVFGMNPKVGNVSFRNMQEEYQFSRPYSDDTAKLIDDEARKIIEKQYERARGLLREKHRELELLANELLNKEVLLKSDVERLIGKRPADEAPEDNGEAKSEDKNLEDEIPDSTQL